MCTIQFSCVIWAPLLFLGNSYLSNHLFIHYGNSNTAGIYNIRTLRLLACITLAKSITLYTMCDMQLPFIVQLHTHKSFERWSIEICILSSRTQYQYYIISYIVYILLTWFDLLHAVGRRKPAWKDNAAKRAKHFSRDFNSGHPCPVNLARSTVSTHTIIDQVSIIIEVSFLSAMSARVGARRRKLLCIGGACGLQERANWVASAQALLPAINYQFSCIYRPGSRYHRSN